MTLEEFLQSSYTAFHAVSAACAMLQTAGFASVQPDRMPLLKEGDKCYTVVGGTSLFAWVVGEGEGLMLAECHTDSPALRVKGSATIPSPEGNRINVEKYGGLLLYSMLDIPLKVAGRVIVATREGVRERLVQSPANVVIPSLCIHHNPDANNLTLNVQQDMLPLAGDVKDVYQWLCPNEKVLDADLLVVPDVAPFASGAQGQFISAPRLDDLAAMYACITALIESKPQGVAMVACFDNEEIGSGTKQGAASTMLPQLIESVMHAAGRRGRGAGLALSVDNGHAMHPAHPEKSDVAGGPVMGGGVVIKHHVNYATTGLSAGIFKQMLDMAGVVYQDYYNRSDIGCGSTLGNIAARGLGLDTVDIGLAQLAMHSAIEMAAKKDVDALKESIKVCLQSALMRQGEEIIIRLK